MDHPLFGVIDARIAEAEARGEFANLPGAGKPLPEQPDPGDAVLNRIATEAGAAPPFVVLAREMTRLRAELADVSDPGERKRMMTEMSLLEVRIDLAKQAWR